jgi:hypothetical protein
MAAGREDYELTSATRPLNRRLFVLFRCIVHHSFARGGGAGEKAASDHHIHIATWT